MRNVLTKIIYTIIFTSVLISANVFAANPASFTLSPSSSSVINGNTFSVSISENGDNVNVVTVKLTYDSTKLQLLSSSCGAALPNKIEEVNNAGEVIGATCYVSPGGGPITGNALVANVSFKALVGTGTSIINMTSGSKIVASGVNIWDQVSGSTTISLTTPTPKPKPTPAPTPTPTPAPIPAPTPTSKPTLKTTPKAVTTTTPVTQSTDNTTAFVSDSYPIVPTTDSSADDTATKTNSTDKAGSILGATTEKKALTNESLDKISSVDTKPKSYNTNWLIAIVVVVVGAVIATVILYRNRLRSIFIKQPIDKQSGKK
jgi:hypothetical protein